MGDFLLRAGLLDLDGALRAHGGHVEGIGGRAAGVRLRDAGEQHAQHTGDIRGRAEGGARVGRQRLLAYHDGGGQALEAVDIGAGGLRHKALDEAGVGLIDQPLGLGRDGVEDQAGFAGARQPDEDGQLALRDIDADIAQVVIPRAGDADEFLLWHET